MAGEKAPSDLGVPESTSRIVRRASRSNLSGDDRLGRACALVAARREIARRQGHEACPTLLVGGGAKALAASQEVVAAANGVFIVGFVAEEGDHRDPWLAGVDRLGCPDDLPWLVRQTGARAVVVAREAPPDRRLAVALDRCRESGAEVLDLAGLVERLSRRVPIEHVEPTWLGEALAASAGSPGYRAAKRMLDVGISAACLLLLLPVFPALALAISVSTGGSPLYRQERVGLNGRTFRIFKFRTMVAHAEAAGHPKWAESDDQRVTRLGRFLRRTRLDEVPQCINVLRGEMSLIGPRPERPFFVDRLRREIRHYDWRHVMLPGITGWAQVSQGYAASIGESRTKTEFDLYYLKNRSLAFDLKILWRTAGVVLGRRGR